MPEALESLHITGAALITQFSLSVIVLGASYLLYRSEGYVPFHRERQWIGLPWVAVALLIVTIGVLLFTQEFSTVWAPLFGVGTLPLIPAEHALLVTFCANILCVWLLVSITGGTTHSPFTSLYFLIPPLALFLQESAPRVIIYTLFVAAAFSITYYNASPLLRRDTREEVEVPRLPGWIVALAALGLATFIGLVTRT